MSDVAQSSPTIVLIHGAWAGGWIWESLTPLLEQAGIQVLTLDMPGTPAHSASSGALSLQGCADHVLDCCAGVEGPLFLLGHSGGGVIATQAAQALAERVSGVIFVAGMMLPSGCGFADVLADIVKQHPEAAGIGPHLRWSEDGRVSCVPASAAREVFLQDVPEAIAQAAVARLCPQPEGTRALVPCWSAERFGRLPRLYVEALQDRSVVLAAQRRMQELVPGAQIASLNTGHVPQVAAPEALADLLTAFIAQHTSNLEQGRITGTQDPA